MKLSRTLRLVTLLVVLTGTSDLPADVDPCRRDALFSTELEAVIAAMNVYNPRSIREDREYMGAILRAGDSFFRCSVVAGERGRDSIRIRVAKRDWHEIAAFWHTHGAAWPTSRYFSRRDTELVNRYGKPLYLGDYTGYLKKFAPGDRRISIPIARHLGLPAQRGSAFGTLVSDGHYRRVKIQTRTNRISWRG